MFTDIMLEQLVENFKENVVTQAISFGAAGMFLADLLMKAL